MDTPELVDAVSFLMQKLLSSGITPRDLAAALRRGVGVFGSFAAAIAEAREEPSPAELVQWDFVSEHASDAGESTAVVSPIVRHGALNRAKVVCRCVGCGTQFEWECPMDYCCKGCRMSLGKWHRHGSGPVTKMCHRALRGVVNTPALDAGGSNVVTEERNHGDM